MPPVYNDAYADDYWTEDNSASVTGYAQDQREDAKLNPYTAAPNGDSRPWWERAAEYGLSRAIDAHFGPPAVNKTQAPATYAGQNGRTYQQAPNVQSLPPASSGGMGGVLPLVALGAVALLALA